MADSSKTSLTKHQNAPAETQTKIQILFHRLLDECTQFPVPPFLNRRYEISKLLGRGTYFLKKWEMRKQKWYTMQEGRKKIRNLWGDGILYYFYIITFSYLAIMVTHHAFRKSSLKNIFSKIVIPGAYSYIIIMVITSLTAAFEFMV